MSDMVLPQSYNLLDSVGLVAKEGREFISSLKVRMAIIKHSKANLNGC
jgi:hypothetical protein